MGNADAVMAVAQLTIAFRNETISPESAALYAEHLADIPTDLLSRAVSSLIQSQRFFPAVAEIRERAARLAGLLPPTAAEALAIVRRADVSRPVFRRDGSYAYTEREWDWPEDVDADTLDLVRDTLAKVGEPVDAGGKTLFGWDAGFAKTYDVAAEEIKLHILADLPRALAAHDSLRLTDGGSA